MKYLITLFLTLSCLSLVAEDEVITFLPSVDKSTKDGHTSSLPEPDSMEKDGVTISSSDAYFNVKNTNVYKIYQYASITISSGSNLKKIVFKRYTSSGSKFEEYTNMNKGIPGTITISSDRNTATWKAGTSTTNEVTFGITYGGVVWISSIEVTVEKKTGEEITLSSLGYGTMYYGTKSLVVPSGIEAMTYTVDGKKLVCSKTYRAGETIPQATGVVLKGEAGTYTFNYSGETGDAPSGNLLSGSDAEQATSGAGLFYKLAQDPDNAQNVGFFWGADNGGAFTNGAHKAYLCVPASAGVRAFILLNEEATAINKLSTDIQTHETYYTLSGQQLSEKPAKGAVIVSKGKKFVVR